MNLAAGRTLIGIFLLCVVSLIQVCPSGAVGLPVQVVFPRIMPVYGSAENMGCTGEVTTDVVTKDGVTTCRSPGNGSISYLVDGNSPDIDVGTTNWASQLVTVSRSGGTSNFPHPHVLLTFGFDTAVSLTGIEIDLFNCPDWNIGAPSITLYLSPEYDLVYNSSLPFQNGEPSTPSCDSLSNVIINGVNLVSDNYFQTVHIQVIFNGLPIQWVYIGEVRFLDSSGNTIVFLDTTTEPSSSTVMTSSTTIIPSSESTTTTHSSDSSDPTLMTASPTSTSSDTTDTASSSVPTVLIAMAAVIAAIAGALLVVLIIILVVVRKHRNSQTKLETLENEGGEGEVELKSVEQGRDEYVADNPLYSTSTPGNGHQAEPTPYYNTGEGKAALVADNPHYYTTPVDPAPGNEVDDGLYTVVDSEKKATLEPAPPTENKTYASVSEVSRKSPSPASRDSAPVYAMVDKAKLSKRQKKPPGISNGLLGDENPFDSPAIPPKSPDLQVYLSTQEVVHHPLPLPPSGNKPSKVSALPETLAVGMSSNPNYESADDALSHTSHDADSNVYAMPFIHTSSSATATDDGDIYSEPIQPSDFTQSGAKRLPEEAGEEEEEDGDPRIYSSIYTVAATKERVEPPLEISSSNIKELKELGMGQFGKVVLAQTINLSLKDMRLSDNPNTNIPIYVAVKKLRSNANRAEREAFDKEIKFMSRLNDPNVVRFLGVCYQNPAFIVMEYMERGDLSLFLQQYSEIVDVPTDYSQIPTSSVIKMAVQIASGMKYLASKNFVHRDLASRNCLVGEDFTIKLADFGMSRNLYESHYYKIKGNAILPIRWMATECFYGMFSEKTDVWAFGVTMWELFTLAKDKPYPHLSDTEVVEDAVNKGENRYIHPKPPACPQPVYEVMLCCWISDRKKRATFEALHKMLTLV